MLEIRARKTAGVPARKGRELMFSVQQSLKDEGVAVPMTKLCKWFGVVHRTTYYKPTKGPAKVNSERSQSKR